MAIAASPRRRPLRVIQWSTGNAGRKALRGILAHPDLELVGVHAHSRDKVGRDAAELCGWPKPTGILASNDVAALLALDADCVCHTAQGETRIRETVDVLCRILASGKNVVNTSIVSLVYPPFSSPKIRSRLEAACAQGRTTFFTSGFDPGWSGDVIPLALASVLRARRLRARVGADGLLHLRRPGLHRGLFRLRATARFRGADAPARMLRGGWGGMVMLLADAFGMKLDEIREEHERLPAPATFETAMGKIEKGTCAGVRFEVQGIVAGRAGAGRGARESPARRHRAAVGIGSPRSKKSGYKIEVKGSPSLHLRDRARGRGRRPQHRRHHGHGDARRERHPGGLRRRAGRRLDPRSADLHGSPVMLRVSIQRR